MADHKSAQDVLNRCEDILVETLALVVQKQSNNASRIELVEFVDATLNKTLARVRGRVLEKAGLNG